MKGWGRTTDGGRRQGDDWLTVTSPFNGAHLLSTIPGKLLSVHTHNNVMYKRDEILLTRLQQQSNTLANISKVTQIGRVPLEGS